MSIKVLHIINLELSMMKHKNYYTNNTPLPSYRQDGKSNTHVIHSYQHNLHPNNIEFLHKQEQYLKNIKDYRCIYYSNTIVSGFLINNNLHLNYNFTRSTNFYHLRHHINTIIQNIFLSQNNYGININH
jgi:hypothetical protein